MRKLSEQVEQVEQDAKYWKKEYLFMKEERNGAHDTINEYRVEAEDLRLLTDELIAERGSAYLKRDIAEDKVEEVEQERDILAYENRSLAEFIKRNDNTLTDSDVGDIACGAPDVWDSFIKKQVKKWEPQGGAYKAMHTHNRLLAYVAEFGGDWEANWEDTDQEKWYVYYDHQNEMWEFNMGYTHQDLGNVYMPYDCARGLTRKLHRGEVEL